MLESGILSYYLRLREKIGGEVSLDLARRLEKGGAFSGGRVWAHAATSKDALRPLQARRFHGKGSGLLDMDTPTIGGLQVCCEAETILFIILS